MESDFEKAYFSHDPNIVVKINDWQIGTKNACQEGWTKIVEDMIAESERNGEKGCFSKDDWNWGLYNACRGGI